MKKLIIFLCVLLGFAAQASALLITQPVSVPAFGVVAYGDDNGQAAINTAIAPYLGGAVELYKKNSDGSEVDPLSGSYDTTFDSEFSDATITYTGGEIVGPPAFLLVKDGNQSPNWYLFGLTILGWNGTDTIEVQDFWTGNGSISHVTLYGTTSSVPEPATILLFGAGLLGLAGFGKKKFK